MDIRRRAWSTLAFGICGVICSGLLGVAQSSDLDPQSHARLPYLQRKDMDAAALAIFDQLPGRSADGSLGGPLAFAAYNPAVAKALLDLHNGAVAQYIAKRTGNALKGTATMQFATDLGPTIFEPLGWRPLSTTSVFKTAGRLKRLPFPMWLFAKLPEKPYGVPSRPWTGVCVLEPAPA